MNAYSVRTEFNDLLAFPVANSDGCGFIVRFLSKQLAGMPIAYFIAIGKHEWYIGTGKITAFWGPDVFEFVKNLLLKEMDTYSIDEVLNAKALDPIIESAITNCKEVGELKYDKMMEDMQESLAEYASSFNWNSSDYFLGSF